MQHHRGFVLPFLVLTFLAAVAAEPQDSNRQIRQSLKDNVQESWIYNDLNAGFAEAKKTGKPLLVVFR
jgi:hypothetical protein